MKSNGLQRDVKVTQELPTSNFGIVANAKMFDILADKLYSDKILAVVREILCNGLDAHGMNGQTRAFDVTSPTHLEPMFVVRDYGPGMTDDMVMNVYTQFGASTKDGDDEAIGGFGLGCKSPFAYTDAFTVTSWQDGVRRTYAAYRDSDGCPVMALAGEETVDEPNGIEVRVPVKAEDFDEFEEKIVKILRHFPEGSYSVPGVEVDRIEYSTETPTYKVRAQRHSHANAFVLMGPVAYPLDWDQILTEENDQPLPANIVLRFEIGELGLLPSREGLSYDKVTLARLRQRYLDIVTGLADQMFEECKALDSIYDRMRYIHQAKENGTWKFVQKRFAEPPKDGQTLNLVHESAVVTFPGILDLYTLPGLPMRTAVSKTGRKRWNGSDDDIPNADVRSNRFAPTKDYPAMQIGIEKLGGNTIFIFDDLPVDMPDAKRRISARLKRKCNEAFKDLDFVIFDRYRYAKMTDEEHRQWLKGEFDRGAMLHAEGVNSKDDIKALLPDWPLADTHVLNMSELELPVGKVAAKKARDPNHKTQLRVVACLGSKFSSYRSRWTGNCWQEQGELVDGGVYVPLKSLDLDGFDAKWFGYTYAANLLVYGLSIKAREQVRREGTGDDWVLLDAWVKAQFARDKADPEIKAWLDWEATIEEIDRRWPGLRDVLTGGGFEIFPELTEPLTAPADKSDSLSGMKDFLRREGKEPPTGKISKRVVRAIDNVYRRSPLLRMAVKVRVADYRYILTPASDDLRALAKVRRNQD